MGNRSSHKVYSDKRIITIVRVNVKKKWGYGFLTSIVVKRSNNKEYEFSYADLPRLSLNDVEEMYLLKVQGKLHHLKLDFEMDFINAPLLYIRKVVIKNRVEDVQLGIDKKRPYITFGTEKGIVYLNKHDMNSLMKLDEVHKFYDAVAKKLKELIKKDELTITDLEGVGLEMLKKQYKNYVELEYHVDQLKATMLTEAQWSNGEGDVSKPRSFKQHMSKRAKPHSCFYNRGIEDMIPDRWSKKIHIYQINALNIIYQWDDARKDFFKA
ncbi:hypothetical protein Tco_1420461 [Tanacetum coccineum]